MCRRQESLVRAICFEEEKSLGIKHEFLFSSVWLRSEKSHLGGAGIPSHAQPVAAEASPLCTQLVGALPAGCPDARGLV